MNQLDAIHRLTQYDRQEELCVFTKDDLRTIFHEDDIHAFEASLRRLIKSNVLRRAANGVYVFTLADNKLDILESVAVSLRRGGYNYVSLESALSEYGVISQIPMRLTVMTTGRRGTFHTPYGTIEFTHTARHWLDVLDGTLETKTPLRMATKQTAYHDLKHVGRNLHLIDDEELFENDGYDDTRHTGPQGAGQRP